MEFFHEEKNYIPILFIYSLTLFYLVVPLDLFQGNVYLH